jgi:IS5 family transposase
MPIVLRTSKQALETPPLWSIWFRVIKRQFGFQKTRLRGMLKNRCKVHVLAALSNLFMARYELLLCRI